MDNRGETGRRARKIFSGNLAYQLSLRSYSQAALADDMQRELGLVNSPRALVSNYVNGKVLPGTERLAVLCSILNCESEDLVGGPEELNPPNQPAKLLDGDSEFRFNELPTGGVQLSMDMELDWNTAVAILEIVKEFKDRREEI